MGPPAHTDKVAVALWEAPAVSTANTAGRLRVANPVARAPHHPSSWLKSVSVPLGSTFLVPTEIICKGARARRGGPCPAWAPHLLAPGSVQPQGTPGWEGWRGWFGGLVLLPGKAAGLGASILAVWADLEKLLNLCKKLVNVSPFGGPFLPPQCPLPP